MSFNRGETSHADSEDTEPVTNPEEIDIDEDDDDDDDEPGMKLVMLYFHGKTELVQTQFLINPLTQEDTWFLQIEREGSILAWRDRSYIKLNFLFYRLHCLDRPTSKFFCFLFFVFFCFFFFTLCF